MNRGRWFFLRAYMFVVLLVVVVGFLLETLLEQRHQDALQAREMALVQGAYLYADALYKQQPDLPPDQIAAQLLSTLALPVAVHALADFAAIEEEFALLRGGEIIQLYDSEDRPLFYRRLAESDQVLAFGPAPGFENARAKWVVPVFYGFIALAVFLWIRPLMRDLDSLQRSAQAFGTQDFSARSDLPRGSWLLPLGEAFNSMARRIETLLQSHRELTHAVSHELRTPLARLRFSLEMLARDGEAEQSRRIVAMNEDIDELNALVEEMLGYAEMEGGNLEAQLAPLDSTWLQQYVAYYNSHQCVLPLQLNEPGKAVVIVADERLLRRAVDNLAGNAQRFARQLIALRIECRNGEYRLSVADDGPGIPLEHRQAVLSAYVRLGNEVAEGKRGFGLGLAIVQRIMQLHGGRVEIEEAVGGGALITLVWPQTPED